MILVSDIGNTTIKFAVYTIKSKSLVRVTTIDTYSKKLNSVLKSFLNKFPIKGCLCSSVVPSSYKTLKNFLKKNKIICYEIKDKQIKKNINIKIKNKKSLGSDRIVNSISSLNLYKTNTIVVDFGTATTFDVAERPNLYVGGIISPGIKMSLESLHSFTAKLPLIKLKATKKIIGNDTKSAINSGVYSGYISLISGTLSKIIRERKKKYKIVLTGGYAKMFSKNIGFKNIVNENITLDGLKIILQNNFKKFKL
jgi:type III pantothenate kinase